MVRKATANAATVALRELELRRRRAGDHDRLAERDDDEELEPLGEVLGPDLPGLGREPRPPGHAERHERPGVVERERRQPEHRPRRALGDAAGDPEHAGGEEPDQDARRARPLDRPRRGRGEGQERVPPDLDHDVGDREQQPALAERLRDRDRHQQARQHQRDQQQPDERRVRVELVRRPGRVVPRPPDHEQHERRLAGALPRQVREQQVRDLRDREDEDEVVEELEARRALRDGAVAPQGDPADARHARSVAAAAAAAQAAKCQRVAPCGAAVAVPVTVWNANRYRCHGGGPAPGALYGAVRASPSTLAGQPPSR